MLLETIFPILVDCLLLVVPFQPMDVVSPIVFVILYICLITYDSLFHTFVEITLHMFA